jgi:hypothetical protein
MGEIYCGNNAENKKLVDRRVTLGNRYHCLQKGIGRGLNQPKDPDYLGAYRPLDKRKMYCGKSTTLPDEYDLFGNLPQCLQKGVGIGKRKKAEEKDSSFPFSSHSNFILKTNNRKFIPVIIFIILAVVIFTVLYLLKPDFLSTRDKNNVKHLNKTKFLVTYSVICIILAFVIFLIWFRFLYRRI